MKDTHFLRGYKISCTRLNIQEKDSGSIIITEWKPIRYDYDSYFYEKNHDYLQNRRYYTITDIDNDTISVTLYEYPDICSNLYLRDNEGVKIANQYYKIDKIIQFS